MNTTTNQEAASGEIWHRVRYEIKRRQLQVESKTYLTPGLLRIVLKGDLSGFQSQGFDDHVKLIFPDPVTGVVTFPNPDAREGESAGPRPIMRDYTPRYFNLDAGKLTLDFALHGVDGNAGPATRWAVDVKPGDDLHIAGPRGSQLLSKHFQHYVLIGDETAIPAIARRLEEVGADKTITVFIVVDSSEHRLQLITQANADIHWVYRQQQSLLDVLSQSSIATENTHFWVASEREEARAIRDLLVEKYNLPSSVIKASAYWHKGQAGKHGKIE